MRDFDEALRLVERVGQLAVDYVRRPDGNVAPGVPRCAVGSGNGGDVAGSETTAADAEGRCWARPPPTAVYYSP
jgi:hypothetical protein